MYKDGPIIVIEDDPDDREIYNEIFSKLNYVNKIIYFPEAELALEYLSNTTEKPFLILSDINMPKLSGFKLKETIHNNEELRIKCIPYLFLTTATSKKTVIDAYSHSVQGFFVKPYTIADLEDTIKTIVEYWQKCEAPNYTE